MIPASKNPMAKRILYSKDGFAVCAWTGNKGDFLDAEMPEKWDTREMSFVPVFNKAGWLQFDRETGESWAMTRENPLGEKDGQPHYTRTSRLIRSLAMEDGTIRYCVYPIGMGGIQSYDPIAHQYVNGATKLHLPLGGLFLLVEGSFMEQEALHVFRSTKEGGATLYLPDGVRGVAVWRK